MPRSGLSLKSHISDPYASKTACIWGGKSLPLSMITPNFEGGSLGLDRESAPSLVWTCLRGTAPYACTDGGVGTPTSDLTVKSKFRFTHSAGTYG